jgi:hypothetical protein
METLNGKGAVDCDRIAEMKLDEQIFFLDFSEY